MRNVLLIVVDQVIRDTLALYGGAVCKTPCLDRMFRDGVVFDRAYTPISLCTPARASIFTGKSPHRHGLLYNATGHAYGRRDLADTETMLPAHLTTAGYRCGYAGKWHIGTAKGPREFGFEGTRYPGYGIPSGFVPEYDEFLKANGHSGMRAVRFYDALASDNTTEGCLPMAEKHRDTFFYDGIVDLPSHLTEAGFVAQRTIDLLREFSGKPFFVTAAFWGPHHPALPSPEFAGRHDPAAIPPWANFTDDLATKPRIQGRYARCLNRRFTDAPWSLWQRVIARHFDFMAMIDAAIGRIHDELVALGRDQDTVVIFTSDHGDTLGCHGGQFDKGPYMYEETYAVPLLVRGPALRSGRGKGFVSNMDVFASVLELAGVPVPAGVDARSFVPLLHGGLPARDCVTAQFYGFDVRGLYYQEMIRAGDHKYVYNPSDTDELYDLASDPAELHNLIGESSAAGTVRELRQRLVAEMRATGAPFAPAAPELMGLSLDAQIPQPSGIEPCCVARCPNGAM